VLRRIVELPHAPVLASAQRDSAFTVHTTARPQCRRLAVDRPTQTLLRTCKIRSIRQRPALA